MIDFPESTHVHRRIPKEAFYKHLSITSELKEKFVSDVDRIYVEWSLTKENLHLDREADTKEILVLIVELKRQEFPIWMVLKFHLRPREQHGRMLL